MHRIGTILAGVLFALASGDRVGLFSQDAHFHPNPLFRRPGRSPADEETVGLRCSSKYGAGICGSFSSCANWFHIISTDPTFKCKLPDGKSGYCCPRANPNFLRNKVAVFDEPVLRADKIESFGYDEVKEADTEAERILKELEDREKEWEKNGFYEHGQSSVVFHARFFSAHAETNVEGRKAFAAILAAKNLAKKYELTPQAAWGLRQFSVLDTSFKDSCRGNVTCDRGAFYRTFDGSCSNLAQPLWAKANTPFIRLLPPTYEDGIWEPRIHAVSGEQLPSARKISSSLGPEKDRPLNGVTLITMAFGQFLDHDLLLGAIFSGPNDARIPCCSKGKHIKDSKDLHPGCFPIDVPLDDPFYSLHGVECMNFVRALPSPSLECTYGFAHQVNQNSHVLDASMIYGSSEAEAKKLRAPGGKMAVTNIKGWPDALPPQMKDEPDDACADKENELFCFKAGDVRINEQTVLTVVHTLFLREHNRLVGILSELNPHWDDEKLYQETRRIVSAEIQHITYNEWLPLIIGSRALYESGLTPLPSDYWREYDDSVNPSVTSEFNIAFRFGHSILPGLIDLVNERYNTVSGRKLRDMFNNPLELYKPRFLEDLLRGMITQKIQSFDSSFTEEVQQHLFEPKGAAFGLDLVSLNIQRSRDHALNSYNDYRDFCHHDRAKTFDDLLDTMNPEQVEVLKRIYNHVDDIDFFIGGVSEKPVPGAIVGPTFSCIITDQFARAKKGDRFFYEIGGQPHSFNPYQLREIRKVTMARIICDNVKGMKRLQPLVFYESSNINNIVPCDSHLIPEMDLYAGWKDRRLL